MKVSGQFLCKMFVVVRGDCGRFGAEVRVGSRRWLFQESTGEVWVDGESCGVGLGLEMAAL